MTLSQLDLDKVREAYFLLDDLGRMSAVDGIGQDRRDSARRTAQLLSDVLRDNQGMERRSLHFP